VSPMKFELGCYIPEDDEDDGHSVGIFRSRTKSHGVYLSLAKSVVCKST
jgi:hypothetical protein